MDEKDSRILVVDDEQDLCEILKFNLETEGYQVETANSAEEALEKDIASYNLLLLDVMMGGMSGFQLAKQLKNSEVTAHIPIIFLTARDTENDTVTGFNLGADDYISKPFSIREVMVRVRAVLRRTASRLEGAEEPAVISYQGLLLNLDKKSVSVDGEDVPFTKTEFECFVCCWRSAEESSRVRNSSTAYGPRMCWFSTVRWMSTSHVCARR